MQYLKNKNFMQPPEYKLVYDDYDMNYTLYYQDMPVESGVVEKRQASELVNEYLEPGWNFKRDYNAPTATYDLFPKE